MFWRELISRFSIKYYRLEEIYELIEVLYEKINKMTKEDLEDLSKNIRKNIINLLELWSSKDKQLEYQKNVPIADVSAELFCQWDDFYYPETEAHKLAFSKKETDIIDIFYLKLKEISKKTPKYLPYLDAFILTIEWIELNKLAKKTLDKLKN